jgi:agmatinase
LEASTQVELYDDELGCEPCRHGIATLPPLEISAEDPVTALGELREGIGAIAAEAPLLAVVGGEHTVTVAAVEAARRRHGELTVLQLDAHADLRDRYDGTPWSHACVMRRIAEGGRVIGVGIRALCEEEAAARSDLPVVHFPARDIVGREGWQGEVLDELGERVYVTVDLDAFDPSEVPAVGTPEPGGLSWYPALRLLRLVAESRTIVGCDVVEACPVDGADPTAFFAARLLYKLIGYALESRRSL